MCAMLLFVNCGDDSPEEIPVVKAIPMSITLDADGSVQMININSNTSWSVMRDDSWLQCSPADGSGNVSVKVSASVNNGDERRSKLTFTDKTGKATASVTVTQKGAPEKTLTVNPESLSFSSSANNNTFTIMSNMSWSVESNASWCTVSPSSGSNNSAIAVKVETNSAVSSRTATITVKGDGIIKTVSVNQEAAEAQLTLSKDAVSISADGGTQSVTVKSNSGWSATSNQSWLTISPSQGNGDGTLTLKATANSNTSSRQATVTVRCGDITKTISVTQEAAAVQLSLSIVVVSISVDGGTQNVTVTCNSSWSATSNQSWLTVSPSQGNGDGTLTLKATANPNTSSRQATVTVRCGSVSKTISVTQEAKPAAQEMVLKEMLERPFGTLYGAAFTLYSYSVIKNKCKEKYVIRDGGKSFSIYASDNSSLDNLVYKGVPFYSLYISDSKYVCYYLHIDKSKQSMPFSKLLDMVNELRALGITMSSETDANYDYYYKGTKNGTYYYATMKDMNLYYEYRIVLSY